MSRTDAHRPFSVQIAEKPVAWHDHSNGPCDLQPLEDWVKEDRNGIRWDRRRRCFWQPTNWHTFPGFARSEGEGDWIVSNKTRKIKPRYMDIREQLTDMYEED